MRIGELSKRTSLSRDTIRFYERKGLISSQPGASQSNNYRDYPEETELTLELVSQAQAAGFTLDELAIFMTQLQASSKQGFDGEEFLDEKIRQVEDGIRRSRKFLETLKQTRTALGKAAEAGSNR